MAKLKTRVFTKRPFQEIPLLNSVQLSLGKSRYIHPTSAAVLTSNFHAVHPVKKVTTDSLINVSFQNKVQVNAVNFRMPWMMI